MTDLRGDQGPIGPQGEQGVQGIQGIQGVQGIQGEKGNGNPLTEPWESTAGWARTRMIGVFLVLLVVLRYAGSTVPGVEALSDGVIGLLGFSLLLISDRRCIGAKRSIGKWLLEWRRAGKDEPINVRK